MNRAGGFQVSVLASSHGLPVVTSPPDYDLDVTAAMVALLTSVASEAQSRVGMGFLDEVTVRSHDRMRLVCRYFQASGDEFILAAFVPPKTAYRRATNRAIAQIQEAWNRG